MLKPIYIKCALSTAILLGGSLPVYAQMAGISSKSAPPTSKSKSKSGVKSPAGQTADGVRQDLPQRDPNDDSYSAGASYSPYPTAEKQNLSKQQGKGMFGKLQQQGTAKTTPATGATTQTQPPAMPPTAPPIGSTNATQPAPGSPSTSQTGVVSNPQQKIGTPQQTQSQTGAAAAPQITGTTAPAAGSPASTAAKGTLPAKGNTPAKSTAKNDGGNKTQTTATTKTTPPAPATTRDATKTSPADSSAPSQPTATVPPTGSPSAPPQNPQTPFAGQPYPPQYQQYQQPPQGYPGQYPYNAPFRPAYQQYPYQPQPNYQTYPNGAPPYQTGYPSGYQTAPTTPPATQQPSYPPGAAEPFSTLKRPSPAQTAPPNYSGYPTQQPQYPAQQSQYPAQQPQYPAQQGYPPQFQRPYYPTQQYPGQQYPGQQFYQTPPSQGYPVAQPPQNSVPVQPQQPLQTQPQSQPQTVQQPPAAQPNQPATQPASPTAQPVDQPKTSSTGGSSAPASDNMTEFLAKVTAARQMISTGNPAFAVDSLDQAVKLRPRNLSVYFYRGLAYDEAGDPSTAVKNYLESIDRAKTVGMDSSELRINLGNSYMKLNFFDDAIVEYQKAIEIEPGSGTAHMQLGRALLSKGDYPGALKNLRKCETLGINDPAVAYLKALCLAAMKQKQEALTELAPLLTRDSASKNPQLNKLAEDLKSDLK